VTSGLAPRKLVPPVGDTWTAKAQQAGAVNYFKLIHCRPCIVKIFSLNSKSAKNPSLIFYELHPVSLLNRPCLFK
jgi:hypothetical protein